METRPSNFKLGVFISGLIDRYRGNRSRTDWVKEAIIEKAEKEEKRIVYQNCEFYKSTDQEEIS